MKSPSENHDSIYYSNGSLMMRKCIKSGSYWCTLYSFFEKLILGKYFIRLYMPHFLYFLFNTFFVNKITYKLIILVNYFRGYTNTCRWLPVRSVAPLTGTLAVNWRQRMLWGSRDGVIEHTGSQQELVSNAGIDRFVTAINIPRCQYHTSWR